MKGRDFVACPSGCRKAPKKLICKAPSVEVTMGRFMKIGAALRKFGIRLPKTEQVHVKMEYCLRNCGDSTAEHIGFELERLRARRKAADYELDDSGIAASSKVETEIASATYPVGRGKVSKLDRRSIKTPRPSQASWFAGFRLGGLQPNNVIPAIDVQHFARDTAGKMAEQVETGVAQIGWL